MDCGDHPRPRRGQFTMIRPLGDLFETEPRPARQGVETLEEFRTLLLALQDAGDRGRVLATGTYDGDTPGSARRKLREFGNAILTNPDMLHQGILPYHARWGRFFSKLRFVVVDEVHTYRGIFGSHVANVLRRLRRIARHYGAVPQFLLSSATLRNPQELAELIVGDEVHVVDQDGSQRGPNHFVFWNPPR